MLFTRCPGCQTTFRISADTLRVAHGAVRCGACATVFSAYTGLRQDSLEEDLEENEDFLSPTLQTQELASIEEIESPDLDASEGGTEDLDEPQHAVATDETDVDEAEEADADEIIELVGDDEDDGAADASAAFDVEPEPADDREAEILEFSVDDADAEPSIEPDDADESHPSGDSSAKLHFEAPVDEWALLMREIERSVDEAPGQPSEGPDDPRREAASAPLVTPLPEPQEPPELWDIGEPFSLDAYDDTAERRKLEKLGRRAAASAEPEASSPPDETENVDRDETADVDEAITAEEIDATLSAEPDPEIIAVLEAGLGPASQDASRTRRWIFGSLALAIVLGVQMLHHFRAELATKPVIGPVLASVYGLAGLELVPEWDLDQYEITNWAATAAPGGGGPGNLHITAQIRNRGPRAQPYPSLLLELKDRWEANIGARVFAPEEYLAEGADDTALMAAGTVVPADLLVVDPGLDASGFELDVCLDVGAGRISCSGDRVFE